MTGRAPAVRRWARGCLLAVLGAVLLVLWHPGERTPVTAAFEGRLLDLRFVLRGPRPAPDTVAIVVFDDLAVTALQAFPPSRADIADTLRQIFDAGAEVVAIDMLLVDPRADDPALAEALRSGASVLGVAEAQASSALPVLSDPGGFGLVIGPPARLPLPAMGPTPGLQGHAALGHVTVRHDRDGMLRRLRPALTVATQGGTATLPGLAVAALSARAPAPGAIPPDLNRPDLIRPDLIRPDLIQPAGGRGGRLEGAWSPANLDLQGALPLDYHGPGGTIPTHSAVALSGVDLTGRIVFLGATATGFGDRHATSFDATLPGVEAHATLAANLLDGRVLRRDLAAWGYGGALAVLVAVAGFAAGGLSRPGLAVLSGGAVTLAALLALQAAFVSGWWIDATTVLAALLAGLGIGGAQRLLDTRRRATNLARYQSPRLVEAIASRADPLGVRAPQTVVVLFVDVAGFTTLAEDIGPAETSRFLAAFHQMVEAVADPLGGAIMNYAGDGVLVVFGLPEPAEGDAWRALQFTETLFRVAVARGLTLRAGGHAGPVQFSLLGGLKHRIVAVSGDVVNTASRLQEFAKSSGAALALSDALIGREDAARAWADRAGLRSRVGQALRGRTATETIWIGDPPWAA